MRTRNSACVAIFDAARLSGERNHDDSGWASPPIRSPYEIRIARDGAIISVGDAFKAADEMVFFFASRENDLVRGRLPGVLSKFYATKVSVPPGLVKKLVKEGHIDAKWLDAPVEKIRNTDVIKVQLITKERVAAAKKRGAASLKKFQEANGVSQQRQLEG